MKKILFISYFLMLGICISAQTTYQGKPLLKANQTKADYCIGNDWKRGSWNISPKIDFDTLFVLCHNMNENFVFCTNQDTLNITVNPDSIFQFYVLLNDTAYACTVIKGIKPTYSSLKFDTIQNSMKQKFVYEENIDNDYLIKLREKYPIDSLARQAKSDTEKVLKIINWVHNQWQHNGGNKPLKNDAISILNEAKEGKKFRCVEYGIVAVACLNSIGLKSRVLALKTKDVETRKYGAGHVLLEVYLNDLKKWVMVDGQWDAMPVLHNIPLNATELQKAISENYNELEIKSLSATSKRHYLDWIYPYLYYFDVSFDNREGTEIERINSGDKPKLMLVPLGAKNPQIFQITKKIDNCLYTNSINDFYAAP